LRSGPSPRTPTSALSTIARGPPRRRPFAARTRLPRGASVLRIARRDRELGRLDRELVHHLDRRREDPGGDDPGHRCAGRVHRPESGEKRADDLRPSHDPEDDPRDDSECPFRPHDYAEEIRAVRVERLAAQFDDVTVRQDEREPGHVVGREAVLEAVRTTRVLRDVAADRAHLLAGRVGRVEEVRRGDGTRDIEVRDAGLDDDALGREVDLEDPVHPRDRDDDSLGDR
jgi:hypothetical protein